MSAPSYDVDDTPFHQRRPMLSGWGLLAPEVFGADRYTPPDQVARPVCAEVDPELFFPEGRGHGSWDYRTAARLCLLCPLRADCLEAALTRHEEHGMWGGTTPKQRQKIWVRREAAA
jgi:hypothetical protein